MATTSCTPVGNCPDSPEPILRRSPANGHDAEILDVDDPDLGYDAEPYPYQQTASPCSRLLSRDTHPMHPVFLALGCLRLLRWTDQGDHLRALIRWRRGSVLTPPHQSPFRIKASGAAPERRSSPCPWRTAPQHMIGTLPCPCGRQVRRSHAWHGLPRSRFPEGASGRTAGLTPTSSPISGLPGLGATRARAHGRGGGLTHGAPTQPMDVRMGVWLIRTSG
jgi:hypothetical protein